MKNEIIEHYHCPKCGKLLEEKTRLAWRSDRGIVIIYFCGDHLFYWKEMEGKIVEIKL